MTSTVRKGKCVSGDTHFIELNRGTETQKLENWFVEFCKVIKFQKQSNMF